MRAPSNLPRRSARSARGRLWLLLIAAALFVLLVSVRGIARFYTDYLWYREVGFTSVWRTVLGAKFALGLIFSIAFFVVLWANLAIADRIAPGYRPVGPEEELVERYHEVVGPHARLVRTAVSILFALIAGPGVAGQWRSWILYRHGVHFGIRDPQFHRDIGFFVFQLPFLKYLVDWAFASFVIVLIVTAVAHYLNGGIRLQTPLQKVTPQVKAHLSVLLGVLALLKAAGYWLQRYQLDFSTRGVVQGASYTDVKAQLPALRLLVFIALLAFVLFIVNIWRRGWVLPIIAVGLWAFVSIVVGAAIPAIVQQFRVQPTESVKERPYIERNIAATRAAMNIDETAVHDFNYSENLNAGDLAQNQETIRNVRLWDPNVLLRNYQQRQVLRPFFEINDVDVDRYPMDGRTTQVELSARELNLDGIPQSTWVNRHLVFTHGYGAVMAPTNAVNSNGDPDLTVSDLPPQGNPQITRPEIYYAPNLSGYAIVKTQRRELDFSGAGGADHTSTYGGKGGVPMGSGIRRLAFFLRFGDFNTVVSGFVRPSSRAVYYRDIQERVRKAAPFLRYDHDPYPVIANGRIVWVQDAYTTTNRYPYSQQANTDRLPGSSGLLADFNYVRNSVKVVIDAYDGSMKFYVVDATDPIVQAYRKAFPGMFVDGTRMEPELRQHLRYPEDMFRVQTNMYGLYHIKDPNAFYTKADRWDIAQEPTPGGGTATQVTIAPGVLAGPTREPRMDPYYLLMRLPNEQSEDFLILQPFVPTSKNDQRKDLSAFMVAKSDPGDFGKLEAFVMPRDLQVAGPSIIQGQIRQNPDVSQTESLLGRQGSGSKVVYGNLLLVPINQSLLYIQPFYVEAEGTPVPELKKVIAAYAGKVVRRDSLQQALTDLFGAAPQTLEKQAGATPGPSPGGAAPPSPSPSPGAAPNASVQDLLGQAQKAFDDAQAALRNGDLSTYQKRVNDASDLVRQAAAAQGSTTTTAPASGRASA